MEDFGVVFTRRLGVADVVSSLERMRLVAGSLIVPCETGLGGVDVGGAEGEPKRLSRSL
jgi:hypothetical protein